MIKPPLLYNEQERLKELLEYEILDTEQDPIFDEIAKMASTICGTPMAIISLIDSERQWFKAKLNIPARETSREYSFCGHAIQNNEIFIVNDAREDERFFNNPFVTGETKIVFYAGAPLVTPLGHAIGTLCVIDHRPKELTEGQKEFLQFLSKQVMTHLELKKSLKKSEQMFKELQHLSKIVLEQEEEIKTKEKLQVISGLASAVAHEICNPLAIIGGKADVALDLISQEASWHVIAQTITKIQTTAERITKVVRALEGVSSQPVENFKDGASIEEAFYNKVNDLRKSS